MKRIKFLSSAIFAFALIFGTAVQAQDNSSGGAKKLSPDNNIVENAMSSPDHKTLVAAIQAAGLVETLQGEGPFTVFAPTDAAFEVLPSGTLETLLMPENKEKLAGILTYHVVPGMSMASDVVKAIGDGGGKAEFTTVNGATLTAMMQGENVILEDAGGNKATITTTDIKSSNGVIHVIDTVLLPGM